MIIDDIISDVWSQLLITIDTSTDRNTPKDELHIDLLCTDILAVLICILGLT